MIGKHKVIAIEDNEFLIGVKASLRIEPQNVFRYNIS